MKYISKTMLIVVLIFLVLTLPLAHEKIFFGSVPLYFPEGITVIASFLFLLQVRARKLQSVTFGDKIFLSGVVLFFFGALLSFLWNPLSLTGLGMLKTWFFFPILFAFLLINTVKKEHEKNLLLFTWMCLGFFISVAALLWWFTGNMTYDHRLQAFYTSPNFLAFMVGPSILLVPYFWAIRSSLRERIFLLGILSCMLTVLFLTHSYTAWFSLAFSFLLQAVLFFREKRNLRFFLWGITFLLVFLGAFLFIEHGSEKWQALVSFQERSSFSSRLMIWRASEKMISDTFPMGIGIGRFQEMYLEYQKYFPPYLEWAVPQPHNLYLALLLQVGLIGCLGFGLILLSLGKILWLVKSEYQGMTLLSLLVFYLTTGLFDTPYFSTELTFSFWLLVGMILCVDQMKK